MKKTICVLMLFTSITGSLCAQTVNKSDKTFEVPENIVFNRHFMLDLGKGNKMDIKVSDISDLERLSNMDSLLQIFVNDITPLKDSLADPLTSKRVDYFTDTKG